jgi:hypothetical protein
MATYYALPTLSVWGSTSGWSLTSGGADAGVAPDTGDIAIFDANSGPARTITLASYFIANLQNLSGRTFTFSGTADFYITSGSTGAIDLSNCVFLVRVYMYGNTSGGSRNLRAVNASLQDLTILLGSITLQSDLLVKGTLSLSSGATTDALRAGLVANGYTVTLAAFATSLTGGGSKMSTLDMGTGNWIVTGLSADGAAWWDSTTLSSFAGASSTLIFRNSSGAARRVYVKIPGGTQFGTVWNDCGGMISLNLQYSNNGSLVPRVNLLKASPGSITEIDTVSSGLPLYVGSTEINGSGLPITLRGIRLGTNAIAYLTGVAGGFHTLFYANLLNLSFAAPSGVNWRAVRSTNSGFVTGMNFTKDAGSFFPFM